MMKTLRIAILSLLALGLTHVPALADADEQANPGVADIKSGCSRCGKSDCMNPTCGKERKAKAKASPKVKAKNADATKSACAKCAKGECKDPECGKKGCAKCAKEDGKKSHSDKDKKGCAKCAKGECKDPECGKKGCAKCAKEDGKKSHGDRDRKGCAKCAKEACKDPACGTKQAEVAKAKAAAKPKTPPQKRGPGHFFKRRGSHHGGHRHFGHGFAPGLHQKQAELHHLHAALGHLLAARQNEMANALQKEIQKRQQALHEQAAKHQSELRQRMQHHRRQFLEGLQKRRAEAGKPKVKPQPRPDAKKSDEAARRARADLEAAHKRLRELKGEIEKRRPKREHDRDRAHPGHPGDKKKDDDREHREHRHDKDGDKKHHDRDKKDHHGDHRDDDGKRKNRPKDKETSAERVLVRV